MNRVVGQKSLPAAVFSAIGKRPLTATAIGAGGLALASGGSYLAYKQMTGNSLPSLTELPPQEATQAPVSSSQPSAQTQQMIEQATTQSRYGEPQITAEDMLKERLRLAKEQRSLTKDVAINEVYQKALGYDPSLN
jgi:hypothetical protein